MGDLFETKQISPMLIAENVPPFSDDDYIYEMKWDGERCVAYLNPSGETELRNKRNVRMLPKVPELADIHKQASARCILYGVRICLVNGKPSFETTQRRILMGNPYKINLEADGNKDAIWLNPDLVCCVEFMHWTKNGGIDSLCLRGCGWINGQGSALPQILQIDRICSLLKRCSRIK